MPSQQPVTIIMVEDDEGHARLIEKNIRRAGVCNEIRTFASGTGALEHLFSENVRNAGPFLVLLDLNLPDMNGVDILIKLKADEKLKRAPVVVLTTTDDQREIQLPPADGIDERDAVDALRGLVERGFDEVSCI